MIDGVTENFTMEGNKREWSMDLLVENSLIRLYSMPKYEQFDTSIIKILTISTFKT